MAYVHMCFIECFDRRPTPHELAEQWSVEYELMKKGYPYYVKKRGIDPGQEVLQVHADPFELKLSENVEDGACWRR
jgi:hypothetical protein